MLLSKKDNIEQIFLKEHQKNNLLHHILIGNVATNKIKDAQHREQDRKEMMHSYS